MQDYAGERKNIQTEMAQGNRLKEKISRRKQGAKVAPLQSTPSGGAGREGWKPRAFSGVAGRSKMGVRVESQMGIWCKVRRCK